MFENLSDRLDRAFKLLKGEGKITDINVAETVKDILGGVRSTCTYVGASQLKELSKRTTFIRVQEQHNEVFGNE